MQKTATLNIRIDPKTKREAEKIFNQLGLSMTTAVNLFFRQAISDRALPFQPKINDELGEPNAESIAAMKEVEAAIAAGTPAPYENADAMFNDIGF